MLIFENYTFQFALVSLFFSFSISLYLPACCFASHCLNNLMYLRPFLSFFLFLSSNSLSLSCWTLELFKCILASFLSLDQFFLTVKRMHTCLFVLQATLNKISCFFCLSLFHYLKNYIFQMTLFIHVNPSRTLPYQANQITSVRCLLLQGYDLRRLRT